jgi:hypothetical protein
VVAPGSAEDLYELFPAEFVGARNALVRRLRATGERDQASEVAKLRRPPVSAWALNQLARHQPERIGRVLTAGAALRAAMDAAVAGDSSGVRGAQAVERTAVSDALGAATEILGAKDQPVTDVATRRMAETLRAAVLDPTIAERLRAGVLEDDQESPGFGLEGTGSEAATGAAAATTSDRAERSDAMKRERRRRAQAERAELQAEAQRLSDRAQRLGARAEEAEARATEARAQAERAEAAASAAWERVGDREP